MSVIYSGPFSRVINAVAAIATKVGGTVTNTGNRLADNLEAIAGADIGGGGLPPSTSVDSTKVLTVDSEGVPGWALPSSGLPSVTAADDGDVLTVIEGAWGKAAPSGGGVLSVIDNNGTLDKTWAEIYDAGFAIIKSIGPDGMVYTFIIDVYESGIKFYVDTAYPELSGVSISWQKGRTYVTDSEDGYPGPEGPA